MKNMYSKSMCIKYIKNVSLESGAKPPHDKKSLTTPENNHFVNLQYDR